MMRVLVPGGVLCRREAGAWKATVKPPTAATDEWTHFEHDAGRSCISRDALAGPPASLQWAAGSRWPLYRTFHDPPVGFVSSGGRNFYWVTRAKERSGDPDRSRLFCRDAYNGVLLWEREVHGPSRPTCMVAAQGRLYVHFPARDGLVALDGRTGETLLVFSTPPADYWSVLAHRNGVLVDGGGGRLRAFDSDGTALWEKAARRGPDSFLVGEGAVFFLRTAEENGQFDLVSCGLRDGKEKWRTRLEIFPTGERHVTERPAIISVVDGLLILGSASRYARPQSAANYIYSAETGGLLFKHEYVPAGHGGRTASVFPLAGLVWVKTRDAWRGLHPRSGRVVRSIPEVSHRCYPDHATARHIFTGKMDFLDFREGGVFKFLAARSGCGAGFVPANGLVYSHPTRCMCYPMMRGYMAFSATDPELAPSDTPAPRPGPAFGRALSAPEPTGRDWPTLRHDSRRSGSTAIELPLDLKLNWSTRVGSGELSSPVVAGETAFVACPDEHALYALDAHSGDIRWTVTAGARIDSPPSVWRGRVLFGAADGYVYCLDARDGALAWRFPAAPARRFIMVREQLESAWPVHGSVLVHDGVAYFGAGRHTYVDGGVVFHALDVESGRALWRRRLSVESGSDLWDVPLMRGRAVCMGARLEFEPERGQRPARAGARMLWAPAGLLQDNTAIRSMSGQDNWRRQWFFGGKGEKDHFWRDDREGWRANLLAFNNNMVFGVRQGFRMNHQSEAAGTVPLADRATFPSEVFGMPLERKAGTGWLAEMPPPDQVRLNSLVAAGGAVFVAGASENRGLLHVLSAEDGAVLKRVELPGPPRFDGVAAAHDRLFVCTADGRLICLGGRTGSGLHSQK